jgi:hypothetical protein
MWLQLLVCLGYGWFGTEKLVALFFMHKTIR